MTTETITPDEQLEAEAAKTVEQVFRYSTHVHVGEGAHECEHGTDGKCQEAEHFHAFVRLPNQWQHSDIRQKAQAAKARRLRQLRDPESDAYAILEGDIDALRRADDRPALVDELLMKDWWKRHLDATNDAREQDEFEHIDQDQERLGEIERMAPEDRPQDEHDELVRHLTKFGEAIEAARNEREAPLRDALDAKDDEELLTLVRSDRMDAEASRAFMETYGKWQAFAGTLVPDERRPHVRVFPEIGDLENADPQIVEPIREAFARLETGLQRPPF